MRSPLRATLILTALLLALSPGPRAFASPTASPGDRITLRPDTHSAPLRAPARGARSHTPPPASTPHRVPTARFSPWRGRSGAMLAVMPLAAPDAAASGIAAAPTQTATAVRRLSLWREAGRGPPRAGPRSLPSRRILAGNPSRRRPLRNPVAAFTAATHVALATAPQSALRPPTSLELPRHVPPASGPALPLDSPTHGGSS